MAFAARLPADLNAWLDRVAADDGRSKNAILITALEEYRQRRELAHVLKPTDQTAHDHRNLLDRLEVRVGGVGDVPAVLRFWVEAAEGTERQDSAEKVLGLLERDPEALLIAELSGEIAGTLIAGWDGWRAHLYRLAVHPEHRRKGIARTLLGVAEQRFARFGAFRADAMVLRDNALAHHAWSAAGYTRQMNWARWVKPLAR